MGAHHRRAEAGAAMDRPTFDEVARGYDPRQVDEYLGVLWRYASQVTSRAAAAESALRHERDRWEAEARIAEGMAAQAGGRIGLMLAIAQKEADDIIAGARQLAEAALEDAVEDAGANHPIVREAREQAEKLLLDAVEESRRLALTRHEDLEAEIVRGTHSLEALRRQQGEIIGAVLRLRGLLGGDEIDRAVSDLARAGLTPEGSPLDPPRVGPDGTPAGARIGAPGHSGQGPGAHAPGPGTSGPATSAPPTSAPPTSAPPTSAPPTSAPPTSAPPTSGPGASGSAASGPGARQTSAGPPPSPAHPAAPWSGDGTSPNAAPNQYGYGPPSFGGDGVQGAAGGSGHPTATGHAPEQVAPTPRSAPGTGPAAATGPAARPGFTAQAGHAGGAGQNDAGAWFPSAPAAAATTGGGWVAQGVPTAGAAAGSRATGSMGFTSPAAAGSARHAGGGGVGARRGPGRHRQQRDVPDAEPYPTDGSGEAVGPAGAATGPVHMAAAGYRPASEDEIIDAEIVEE